MNADSNVLVLLFASNLFAKRNAHKILCLLTNNMIALINALAEIVVSLNSMIL